MEVGLVQRRARMLVHHLCRFGTCLLVGDHSGPVPHSASQTEVEGPDIEALNRLCPTSSAQARCSNDSLS